MSAGRMRFFPPTSAKKERDEELALFRELFKREREKNMNLLESVSTEFEPVEGVQNRPRPKSPGSLSVASTATSSRLETAVVNPNAPSIRKAVNMVRGKEDPKPVERSINRFSKEGPTKQKPDPKLQTRQIKSVVTKPTPSSRSVTSAISSRPDSPDSKSIKHKGVPKSLEKQVKKTIKEAPAKHNPELKSNNRTVSPLVRSRFPATHPDFPTEAPPNLITSVAPGRSTSATRPRPGVPAMASAEERRSPSATKTRRPEMEEEKKNEKRGGNNGAVVIGSSMVERMLTARKSTATGKMSAGGEKVSKLRGV